MGRRTVDQCAEDKHLVLLCVAFTAVDLCMAAPGFTVDAQDSRFVIRGSCVLLVKVNSSFVVGVCRRCHYKKASCLRGATLEESLATISLTGLPLLAHKPGSRLAGTIDAALELP